MDEALLDVLIGEHLGRRGRYERLWRYYRNPARQGEGGRARLAQEEGLPARLLADAERERVIENDIAWRVHTLVDFMFGSPVSVQSLAAGPGRAGEIERFLRKVLEQAGGVGFLQDLALLGTVYGFADVLVRVEDGAGGADAAERVVLELVEAPRAVPLMSEGDYRKLAGYAVHVRQQTRELDRDGLLARVRERMGRGSAGGRRRIVERTQVWTAARYRRYRGSGRERELVAEEVNRLGRVPVVHIQNLPQPYVYEGLSEVEPLIPLQDELNRRLSDRANRVTLQSFKMYLGKGIESFTERPIGPGQMWATENAEASIEEFGGDAASPSEQAHIEEIREALDKTSGVPPVAAGLLKGKVGNLTSESALRVVLMGLLAKTQKKRVTYGAGLARLCELVLHAADVHGLLPNRPEERRVRLEWPEVLPSGQSERLRNAGRKLELGVPRKQVLAELGYEEEGE
ncbi:MAG: phage portal protein [Phycisphaeraceae bacterium]